MNDAWTLLAADAAQIVDVMKQGVHQRARRVPSRQVAPPCPAGFVDDEDVRSRVINDQDRQVFGDRRRFGDPGRSSDTTLPAFTRRFALATRPSTWTSPSSMKRCSCDQGMPGDFGDRKRSRRAVVFLGDGQVSGAMSGAFRAFGGQAVDRPSTTEHDDRERCEDNRDELRRREHQHHAARIVAVELDDEARIA